MVAKGVLANETVNYETRTKVYVIKHKLLTRAVQVKEQVSEETVRTLEIRCS